MYEKLIIYETQAKAKAQREREHQSLKHHLKLPAHHYRCFRRYLLICLVSCMVIEECLTTYSTSLEPPEPQSQLASAAIAARYTETTTLISNNLLPYFDFDVPRNITVTVGQTGFMHCRVERMGDKDVSWIRKRDLHILTAGSTTYTSDQRFQVIRPENSGNWTLQIKYPQPRDSGIYECQINTEPKMSLSYTFNVIELKANIIGPTDLYVKSGSDINLTCKILQGPHELGNIFWYKGNDIIDMTTNQNEIDSGSRISVDHDWTNGLTSRLKVHHALSSDTGNYTCVPTIAKSASVYVHVIIGEHPAAMQHNSSSMHNINFYTNICCLMLYTILTWCLQHLLTTTTTTTISPSMCKRFGGDGGDGGGSVSIITLSATLGTFLITLSKAKTTKTKTTTTTIMPATLGMARVATSVTTSQQSHSKASLPSTTATATATATATTIITIITQTQTIYAKHFSRHRDLLQAEPTRNTR